MASISTPTVKQVMEIINRLPLIEEQVALMTYIARACTPEKLKEFILDEAVYDWCLKHSKIFTDLAKR